MKPSKLRPSSLFTSILSGSWWTPSSFATSNKKNSVSSWFSSSAPKHQRSSSDCSTSTEDDQHPESCIYDMCLEMKWQEAIQQCRIRPIDATYQEGDNLETPLYMACQNRPSLAVVRALLKAFPEGSTTRSRMNGDLPIHIACFYNASIDVLRVLVKDYPETACQQTKWGATPLVALWDGRSSQEGFIETRVARKSKTSCESNGKSKFETLQVYDTIFWKKMDVLLEAVARHRQESLGQSTEYLYILHAAISLGALGCPLEVLKYVMNKYPDQIRMRDGTGRLPLHIAVGPLGSLDSQPRVSWAARSLKMKPQELHTINLLLERYPEAAREVDHNAQGRYPLHTAIANRHTWSGGLRLIFEKAPEVVRMLDPVEGVYPFQMSATDIDTSFHLISSCPSVLQDFRHYASGILQKETDHKVTEKRRA